MSPEEREAQETPEGEQEQPAPADPAPAAEPAPAHPYPIAASGTPRPIGGAGRGGRARSEGPERRPRRFGRRKVCAFCVEKVRAIDYKDPLKFRRYISDRGRIEPRRKTGTCTKHQRWLSLALKRARHLALLPYTPEHIRLTGVFSSRG